MSQTTYTVDLAAAALPGQIADCTDGRDIISLVAAEDLPMGRLVRLKTGTNQVELPKDDTLPVAGVTVYVNTLQGSYPQGGLVIKAGDVVAVLRRGRVWVGYDNGGTPTPLGNVQMKNNAAAPTTQGMVTATAASADVTRSLGGKVKMAHQNEKTTTMMLVEINCPD